MTFFFIRIQLKYYLKIIINKKFFFYFISISISICKNNFFIRYFFPFHFCNNLNNKFQRKLKIQNIFLIFSLISQNLIFLTFKHFSMRAQKAFPFHQNNIFFFLTIIFTQIFKLIFLKYRFAL